MQVRTALYPDLCNVHSAQLGTTVCKVVFRHLVMVFVLLVVFLFEAVELIHLVILVPLVLIVCLVVRHLQAMDYAHPAVFLPLVPARLLLARLALLDHFVCPVAANFKVTECVQRAPFQLLEAVCGLLVPFVQQGPTV